jgi:hypothetical protein
MSVVCDWGILSLEHGSRDPIDKFKENQRSELIELFFLLNIIKTCSLRVIIGSFSHLKK